MALLAAAAIWPLAALALLAVAAVLLLATPLREWPLSLLERHLFTDANQIMLRNAKRASGATQLGRVFRVLAFGDSLTEGFTQGGSDFQPYVGALGDALYPHLPQGWHMEVEEQGESGERVLVGMRLRLARTLEEHAAAGRNYDWCLLLGGINDLGGDGCSAQEVMDGLSGLVEACLQHGANVLLMTLLEVADPLPAMEEQRLQLNCLIRDYVQQRSWAATNGSSQPANGAHQQQEQQHKQPQGAAAPPTPLARRGAPRVVLFDLASALPWASATDEQRWELWDDGVHLSAAGYDHMGRLIAGALTPLMTAELAAAAAAAAAAEGGGGGDGKSGGKKRV